MSPAVHFLDLGALVGVHLEHASDALLVVLGGVQDHIAGLQRAGIDAHEGQRAVFVVDDLEREPRERCLRSRCLDDQADAGSGPRPRGPPRRRRVMPSTSIRRSADNRARHRADGCTPLFLKAVPHSTGRNSPVMVPFLMARFRVSTETSPFSKYSSMRGVVGRQGCVEQQLAGLVGASRPDRPGSPRHGTSRRARRLPRQSPSSRPGRPRRRSWSSTPIGSCSGRATMSSFSLSVSKAR